MTRPATGDRPGPAQLPEWLGTIRTADGLFVTDLDRRIVAWSASAERLFGRSADEVVGRPCHEVLGSDERHSGCGPGCRPVLEARHGRMMSHPDIDGHRADGRPLALQASLVLVNGEERPPLLVHLVRPRTGPGRRSRATAVVEAAHGASRGQAGDTHDEIPPLVNRLSPRELEVLGLLSTGRSVRQIAEMLTISRFTARNHVLSIERKLGAHSHVEAIYLASHHGLL